MADLHTLVYLSTATNLLTDDELKQILQVSRKNNTEKNISGILVYCEGNILQVLEGENAQLQELYKTIEQDRRHNGHILLQNRALEKRNFEDWSMGFKSATKDEFLALEGQFNLRDRKVAGAGDSNPVENILFDFIKNNG